MVYHVCCFHSEPSTEAEHLNHGEDKNFITAIQMINKDSDKMANHISLPIASVHTSKTGTDSAIVKGDQHMNCNSIHSHIIIEPTRSSISKRTGLSNEIDNSKETILTTSNQSNIEVGVL